MTSFKISSDDQAVRALQKNNKSPVISGPVLPVKASNPVEKSSENSALNASQTNYKRYENQHTQRRKFDRRKSDSHVLLETRNQHDRRVKSDRITDSDENKEVIPTLHGIDETV